MSFIITPFGAMILAAHPIANNKGRRVVGVKLLGGLLVAEALCDLRGDFFALGQEDAPVLKDDYLGRTLSLIRPSSSSHDWIRIPCLLASRMVMFLEYSLFMRPDVISLPRPLFLSYWLTHAL